jgi:hypothetical protein
VPTPPEARLINILCPGCTFPLIANGVETDRRRLTDAIADLEAHPCLRNRTSQVPNADGRV